MKTLVIFYSYSGTTKRIALNYAVQNAAETLEVLDAKRPGIFEAYTSGCKAAIAGKAWEIKPLTINLAPYKRLVVFAPRWGNNPPPAFNALLALLPAGKKVEIKAVSGSGKSGSKCKERISAALAAKGCTLESFEDIKVKAALQGL
jgi:flavodoxin